MVIWLAMPAATRGHVAELGRGGQEPGQLTAERAGQVAQVVVDQPVDPRSATPGTAANPKASSDCRLPGSAALPAAEPGGQRGTSQPGDLGEEPQLVEGDTSAGDGVAATGDDDGAQGLASGGHRGSGN